MAPLFSLRNTKIMQKMQKNAFGILVQTALMLSQFWTIEKITPKPALLSCRHFACTDDEYFHREVLITYYLVIFCHSYHSMELNPQPFAPCQTWDGVVIHTRSLVPADFSVVVFTCAHFQKIAQISNLWDFHYISERIPSLMRFWLLMTWVLRIWFTRIFARPKKTARAKEWV